MLISTSRLEQFTSQLSKTDKHGGLKVKETLYLAACTHLQYQE